jgi:microcystin-dependent protein
MASKNLEIGQALSSKTSTIDPPLVGMIFPYAGTTAPTGWLLCDGGAVSSTTYPLLFAMIGATLPDLRGKYVIGTSSTTMASAGANNHTHTQTYGATNSDTTTYTHTHTTYSSAPDSVYQAHNHAANHSPYINAFGSNSATKSGTAQGNLTNQNHNHSAAGGYWTANINAAGINHGHSTGSVSSNNSAAPTHSHTIAASNTETISSNTAINIPPTKYINFIVKAG